MKKIIKQIEKEIKTKLLPQLKVFKNFRISNIYSQYDYLGFYKLGTYKNPIIKLNISGIYNACQKYNVDLYTAIYTTLLHEIAHAIQEYKDIFTNEEQAEDFAVEYYDYGKILKI